MLSVPNSFTLSQPLSSPLFGNWRNAVALLPTSTAYWLASIYDSGTDSLTEQIGGGVGNAQLGSTSGADTNDPLVLPWYDPSVVDVTVDSVNYVYLSAELVTNGSFDNWTADDPDGWTVSGESGSDPMVTEVSGAARIFSSGVYIEMAQGGLLAVGKKYLFSYDTIANASGDIALANPQTSLSTVVGSHEFVFTATTTAFGIKRLTGGGDDQTIDNVSVREVAVAAGDYTYLPGTAGNNISVARPVASVDVVVTYHDDSTDSTLTAQTANPLVFGETDVVFAGLKIKSIQLKNNAGGAEVGLWEADQAVQAGFTDSYANDFTHNRTATGAFLQLSAQPNSQLHTDDYYSIAASGSLPATGFLYQLWRDHNASSVQVLTEVAITDAGFLILQNDQAEFMAGVVTATSLDAGEQTTLIAELNTILGGRVGD